MTDDFLTLRVMRLTKRCSLADNLLDGFYGAEKFPGLVLPTSVLDVFCGETFIVFVSITNESASQSALAVHAEVELEDRSHAESFAEVETLNPGESLDFAPSIVLPNKPGIISLSVTYQFRTTKFAEPRRTRKTYKLNLQTMLDLKLVAAFLPESSSLPNIPQPKFEPFDTLAKIDSIAVPPPRRDPVAVQLTAGLVGKFPVTITEVAITASDGWTAIKGSSHPPLCYLQPMLSSSQRTPLAKSEIRTVAWFENRETENTQGIIFPETTEKVIALDTPADTSIVVSCMQVALTPPLPTFKAAVRWVAPATGAEGLAEAILRINQPQRNFQVRFLNSDTTVVVGQPFYLPFEITALKETSIGATVCIRFDFDNLGNMRVQAKDEEIIGAIPLGHKRIIKIPAVLIRRGLQDIKGFKVGLTDEDLEEDFSVGCVLGV